MSNRRNALLPEHENMKKTQHKLQSLQDKMLQCNKKASKRAKTYEQNEEEIKKPQDDLEDHARNIDTETFQEAKKSFLARKILVVLHLNACPMADLVSCACW